MKKTYVSWNDTNNHVHELIRQMAVDNWKPELIVGIARGGLYPALLLSNYFNVPMSTIQFQLRDGNSKYTATNEHLAEMSYNGTTILVVDDINDTGATLDGIAKRWKSTNWGLTTRVAVLYNNEASETHVPISYSAVEINKANEDEWIVFSWEDWWQRN